VASRAAIGEAFDNLKSGLTEANETLARITDQDFKVEVNLSKLKFDLAGNGTNELLITTLNRIWTLPTQTNNKQDIVIHFDRGDAYWLKGYTHCLIGIQARERPTPFGSNPHDPRLSLHPVS
jgi:hypothetical protein